MFVFTGKPQTAISAVCYHLTQIGATSVNYDAAGNQLNDATYNYQYDAEGRLSYTSAQSWSWWESSVYNAQGQRMTESMPDSGSNTRTLIYPRDLAGHWQGLFDIRPSQNWAVWDVFSMGQQVSGPLTSGCCFGSQGIVTLITARDG